ncbi:hypothetical protein [Stagnihabitans tardus]|uniref:Uncharacterized protein n=1 Tax=Stagnihabitans tardus TaxID=2699202 RepID=A0AAE4YBI5_9RHOB|nr:hypothetical protein [Stagnihabitans tardus]NBZ89626.1 hypothetical protein [Stagnihabitans tardus]
MEQDRSDLPEALANQLAPDETVFWWAIGVRRVNPFLLAVFPLCAVFFTVQLSYDPPSLGGAVRFAFSEGVVAGLLTLLLVGAAGLLVLAVVALGIAVLVALLSNLWKPPVPLVYAITSQRAMSLRTVTSKLLTQTQIKGSHLKIKRLGLAIEPTYPSFTSRFRLRPTFFAKLSEQERQDAIQAALKAGITI